MNNHKHFVLHIAAIRSPFSQFGLSDIRTITASSEEFDEAKMNLAIRELLVRAKTEDQLLCAPKGSTLSLMALGEFFEAGDILRPLVYKFVIREIDEATNARLRQENYRSYSDADHR